jgi:iron complex outermembrane receptor protein
MTPHSGADDPSQAGDLMSVIKLTVARLWPLSALLGMATATAQDAAGGLEEVVVTARKQVENLQQVPIAVSVFSAESIQSKGIDSVVGVAEYSPNVTLDFTSPISGASSALVAFIRGIGQSDFAINFEPGVGIYVDGVYYARTVGSIIDLMDVERIEVLKGPQGTLFGRNTIGGALNVTTRSPTQQFGGDAELTVGEFNRRDMRAFVNIPLNEQVAMSIAYASRNRDGYVERKPYPGFPNAEPSDLRYDAGKLDRLPNGNDLGNQNNDTIRAKLGWDVSDTLQLIVAADYEQVRENSAPSVLVAAFPEAPGALAGLYNACAAGLGPPICTNVAGVGDLTGRSPYGAQFLTGDRRTNYGNGVSGTYIDAWGASATVTWEVSGALTLKSITAYRELDSAFGEDADMSPLVIDHHGFVMDQSQFTQELQLSGNHDRIDWTTGLYFFREAGGIHDLVPLGGGLLQVDGPNTLENVSGAAFGQLSFRILDAWSVTAGARYTDEKKEFYGRQRDRNALAFNLGLPLELHPDPSDPTLYFPPGKLEQDFSNTSLRLGTEFRFSDDLFVYASYAEGFKSGGWDTRLTAPRLEVPGFRPEEAETYEVGLKSEWLGRTLRINTAAFFTDYTDLQLIIQQGISPLTRNAGKSEIKGVELEFEWAPTGALRFAGSYGWIDAEYTELDEAANSSGIFLTNEFNNTPESTFSFTADFAQSLSSQGSLAWHAGYSWKDDVYNDATNTPLLLQDAYGLVSASVTYTSPDEAWSIGVGGDNLTDEDFLVSGFNQPGIGYTIATIGPPRQWWARVKYRF